MRQAFSYYVSKRKTRIVARIHSTEKNTGNREGVEVRVRTFLSSASVFVNAGSVCMLCCSGLLDRTVVHSTVLSCCLSLGRLAADFFLF